MGSGPRAPETADGGNRRSEGRCEMGGVYIGGGALLVILIIILIIVLL